MGQFVFPREEYRLVGIAGILLFLLGVAHCVPASIFQRRLSLLVFSLVCVLVAIAGRWFLASGIHGGAIRGETGYCVGPLSWPAWMTCILPVARSFVRIATLSPTTRPASIESGSEVIPRRGGMSRWGKIKPVLLYPLVVGSVTFVAPLGLYAWFGLREWGWIGVYWTLYLLLLAAALATRKAAFWIIYATLAAVTVLNAAGTMLLAHALGGIH
jgi:hypothetical protein